MSTVVGPQQLWNGVPYLSSHAPLGPSGVTFPSGEMQQRLVRSLYQEANIAPEQVEYVEAHGTGTKASARNSLVS